jgi:pyruvate dehydrogenase E1 component alpha subunit
MRSIDLARKIILDKGWSDEDALKEMDKEVKAIVNKSADFAKDSPEPDPSELYTDVLIEG